MPIGAISRCSRAGRGGAASTSTSVRSASATRRPADADLFYIGGGQDREQALIAPDLAARGAALSEAVAGSAVLLAVCGGYQLLGRYYRDRSGSEQPGAGVLPLHTVAGDSPSDRRRADRVRARSGRTVDGRRVREPRGQDDPRRGRATARSGGSRLRKRRQSPASKGAASAMPSARISTARCYREIRGSRTGCSPRAVAAPHR